MTTPHDLRYSRTHEWVRVDGTRATIGITDYAQSELGDLVYIELPPVGRELRRDAPFGAVESVKAVEDLYAPVSGRVVAVNERLLEDQSPVNADPYGEGWMVVVEMSDPSELEQLLSSEEYAEYVAGSTH